MSRRPRSGTHRTEPCDGLAGRPGDSDGLRKSERPAVCAAGKTHLACVITVLPEGTYILSGRVTEAGDLPHRRRSGRDNRRSDERPRRDDEWSRELRVQRRERRRAGPGDEGRIRASDPERHTGHRACEYRADADPAVRVAWRRLLPHVYRVPILQPARRRHEAHLCGVD